ncbi:MAG: hypothetical protein LBM93_08505 [Oscillospiraceae bacterium]|nr:hypothetical protein [Oscillospiraceae bacterium]
MSATFWLIIGIIGYSLAGLFFIITIIMLVLKDIPKSIIELRYLLKNKNNNITEPIFNVTPHSKPGKTEILSSMANTAKLQENETLSLTQATNTAQVQTSSEVIVSTPTVLDGSGTTVLDDEKFTIIKSVIVVFSEEII